MSPARVLLSDSPAAPGWQNFSPARRPFGTPVRSASLIGSETKEFYTIDHLRPPTWFCGDCQMWPNQQIRHMAQFWIQHQFRLEVYQIFFKKLIHHLKLIIFHSHHLFSFWVLGSPKWVWSPKKPWTSWNRFRVKSMPLPSLNFVRGEFAFTIFAQYRW